MLRIVLPLRWFKFSWIHSKNVFISKFFKTFQNLTKTFFFYVKTSNSNKARNPGISLALDIVYQIVGLDLSESVAVDSRHLLWGRRCLLRLRWRHQDQRGHWSHLSRSSLRWPFWRMRRFYRCHGFSCIRHQEKSEEKKKYMWLINFHHSNMENLFP